MGQALANAFSSCISADILPDGKMYQNIAEKIMLPMLKGNYDLVSKASVTVQNNLNKAAQIVLKAQSAAFDGERATNLVHKVSSYADYNNAAWVLNEPIKDFTVCVADNTLKKNAEFQAKSGLSPVIVRKAESKCCKWCSKLEGVYQYPDDVPKDVYLRHDNCRCTVDYRPGNGKKQNIHSGTEGKRKYIKDEYGNYQLTKEVRVAKAKEMASTEAARKAAAREKRIETWRNKKSNYPQSVYTEYLRNATPGQGEFKTGKGYISSLHQNEINTATLLHKELGGNIELLNEINLYKQKTPDYLWNNRHWELKNISTAKASDSAVRSALKQISDNPGGVVLRCDNNDIDTSETIKVISDRVKRSSTFDVDIMVIKKEKIINILRYKK
ncbi:MAG: hypothetical protein RR198_07990 [Oscillospiraceae bacterium]